jgi:hypothetical protein
MRKGISLLLSLGLLPLAAETPSVLAIRDARIVPVSGPAIAKGTVVVRNGLIEAVGASVSPPGDAWVIDGAGLTVYPGLIDALSTIGIPQAQAAATAGGRGGGAPQVATPPITLPAVAGASTAPRGETGPNNQSWVKAADQIQATDRRIATARSAGFTTAITFPTRGLIAGQGAVVNLAGDAAGKMVVHSPVGMYMSLGRGGFGGGGGGGGYPGSLMGVFAWIRQTYLDADHYQDAKELYARNARGMQRPEYNRELEGVIEARRVLLPANTAVQIARVLKFGAELKRSVVLYEAQEAYRDDAAAQLKKAGVPVLVNLRWPERQRDVDPEQIDSLRVLELRDKAPSTPAALVKVGVRFALYPGQIDSAAGVARFVRRAMESGLTADQAVRALTLSPAEIFGVADRIGSIETGKIANLLVTDGDLFNEKTRIRHILVDGVKYEPAAETPAAGEGTTGQ